MLNNSFVEHFSDTFGIASKPTSSSTANSTESPIEQDEDVSPSQTDAVDSTQPTPLSPFSLSTTWDNGVWRRWFDAMTNDGDDDEVDGVDTESGSDWSDNSSTADPFEDDNADDGDKHQEEAQSLDSFKTSCRCPVTIINDFSTFEAIILSQWDNVIGPANKHVWTGGIPAHSTFCSKLLKFHPSCTLNGEISRENVGLEMAEYKFYVLSEIGYAMGSFIFTIPSTGSLCTISLVLPATQLSSFLAIQRLCINRMRHLIKKFQIILKNDVLQGDTINEVTDLLQSFLTSISRIGINCNPSDAQQLERTAFGKANKNKLNPEFLAAAITVHLESGGVSIVLGEDAEEINMVIDTLALFLQEDECKRSRYAFQSLYAPDLVLQGIITDDNNSFDSSMLTKATSSPTIIDVTRKTARHARSPNEHQILHEEANQNELRQLAQQSTVHKVEGKPPNHTRPRRSRKSSLVNTTEASSIVTDLLSELQSDMYSSEVRLAVIRHFCLKISRKANVIIQFVSEMGADPTNPVPFERLKTLQKLLALSDEQHFRIILAAAERLQPGTYPSLYGDPKEREENIVNVFNDLWTA